VSDPVFTASGLQIQGEGSGPRLQAQRLTFPCDVCGSIKRLLALADRRITRPFTPAERDRYVR
jgi:hypothetical protein